MPTGGLSHGQDGLPTWLKESGVPLAFLHSLAKADFTHWMSWPPHVNQIYRLHFFFPQQRWLSAWLWVPFWSFLLDSKPFHYGGTGCGGSDQSSLRNRALQEKSRDVLRNCHSRPHVQGPLRTRQQPSTWRHEPPAARRLQVAEGSDDG